MHYLFKRRFNYVDQVVITASVYIMVNVSMFAGAAVFFVGTVASALGEDITKEPSDEA